MLVGFDDGLIRNVVLYSMKRRTFTYVRAHRNRWALSARELARLLGRDASMVCRIERCGQVPGGRAALALEVIFGVSPGELFPRLYDCVEEAIMARAARLDEQLAGRTDRKSVRKRELLADMMKRATGNNSGV
jgi:transcriptional regulator with XRE-family HTH domain